MLCRRRTLTGRAACGPATRARPLSLSGRRLNRAEVCRRRARRRRRDAQVVAAPSLGATCAAFGRRKYGNCRPSGATLAGPVEPRLLAGLQTDTRGAAAASARGRARRGSRARSQCALSNSALCSPAEPARRTKLAGRRAYLIARPAGPLERAGSSQRQSASIEQPAASIDRRAASPADWQPAQRQSNLSGLRGPPAQRANIVLHSRAVL